MRLAFQAYIFFVILLTLPRVLYTDNRKLGSHYSWPYSLSVPLSCRENNPYFGYIFPPFQLWTSFFKSRSIQLCCCPRTVETPQTIGNFFFVWKQNHAVSLHKKPNWMAFECYFLGMELKKWWKSHRESQEMVGLILVLRAVHCPSCQ